jgi:aldehyde dehydrogenase (NAD+)
MSQNNKNFIAGSWCNGVTQIANVNPSDLSDTIGYFAQASTEQLDKAIIAAASAQPQWAKTSLEAKQTILMNIGNELMKRRDELGALLSREEGKPLTEGVGEIFRAGQFFTYYAAEVLRQIGDTADSVRLGVEIDVRREPVGIVAIISPWNFPTATAVWKIAPALAFGNAVIWKPANLVTASAVALAEIIARQDIPAGLFNLVMGQGNTVGQHLVESPTINAISFTGSVDVGKQIAASAITNLTKLQMEMGSKNALVVMEDGDLDIAVGAALGGAFGGTGQKCTASSRLVVHSKIHDAFVDKMTVNAQAMVVDNALKEGTQIGPVVSKAQLEENLAWVERAKAEGGNVLCGGDRVERETEGYYMTPAVVAGTKNSWQINREEMFAPIACIIKVDSYDEAVNVVNDTHFGLTSGIITKSLARATDFRRRVRTGVVTINLPTAGTDYHVPFGGRGSSSYGSREQGRYAEEFYTTVKTSYIAAGKPE